MIERGHKETFNIVSDLLREAHGTGNFQEAEFRAKQVQALIQLEAARVRIFSEFGISDIELPSEVKPSEIPPKWDTRRSPELEAFMQGLPQRVYNALSRHGVKSIDELERLMNGDPYPEIMKWQNFGEKSFEKVQEALKTHHSRQGQTS